jgi:hypothetical protein
MVDTNVTARNENYVQTTDAADVKVPCGGVNV